MLDYFAMSRLDEPTDYILYYIGIHGKLTEEEKKIISDLLDTELNSHAGELETSLFMACCPGKVRLEYVPQQAVLPQNRFQHLKDEGIKNALWWYADYPENIAGNPKFASEEKGKVILDIYSRSLARAIKRVKEDDVAPCLQAEFLERVKNKGK